MLGKGRSALEQQEVLVDALEDALAMPSEIVADSANTARLVESITDALEIELSVGPTPMLDEAKASLIPNGQPAVETAYGGAGWT